MHLLALADKRCKPRTRLSRRPAERASGQHVKMDVEDRLASFAIRIEHRAKSTIGVAAVLRQRGGAPDHLPDQRIVIGRQIVRWSEMCDLGITSTCSGACGLMSSMAIRRVIFVDDLCGNLASGNPAKQTLAHSSSLADDRSRDILQIAADFDEPHARPSHSRAP